MINELRIGNTIHQGNHKEWYANVADFTPYTEVQVYSLDRGSNVSYRINDIPLNRETNCTIYGGIKMFEGIVLTIELIEEYGFKLVNPLQREFSNTWFKEGMNEFLTYQYDGF